ncbi:DeoR/GlpR family DNA-binding transcription regulator [Halodurantibacterium flavum]|uniref:DeoR/GlpR family DNA-binding transcription regulator n=1 Tax=Halodurantibacterium flavum TaxID=1382802 RepID=A0ABW4S8M4_9RHOB
MKAKDRRGLIAGVIRDSGQLTVEELARRFSVSPETIRRDLSLLAEQGVLQKIHGGAKRLRLHQEGSFDERLATNAAAKSEIARKLAGLLQPGDTIFLDTGSTTLACAEEIAFVADLTVITNSVAIARALGYRARGARVFLLGGEYSPSNAQTVGPLVIRQLGAFQADYAVLTVTALDPAVGAMDSNIDEAQVARAMIDAARQVVVLADQSKLGKTAGFRVCRTGEIDMLLTDQPPAPPITRALEDAGVVVR